MWLFWKCQSMACWLHRWARDEGMLHAKEAWQKSCSPDDGQEGKRLSSTFPFKGMPHVIKRPPVRPHLLRVPSLQQH